MEKVRTRRAALALFGAATTKALTEMKTAGATGNSYCRREGHSCNGNQRCCPGLDCEYTGRGNNKECMEEIPEEPEEPTCDHDHECPNNCECGGGQCQPTNTTSYTACVAAVYNQSVKDGCPRQLNCHGIRLPNRRRACHRKNRNNNRACRRAKTQASSFAVAYCQSQTTTTPA